jgi:hypothetical protein
MQLFSSDRFSWNGKKGGATLRALELDGFPRRGFQVKSVKTNKWLSFLYDNEVNERNEFFDGEMCVYSCNDFSITLRH